MSMKLLKSLRVMLWHKSSKKRKRKIKVRKRTRVQMQKVVKRVKTTRMERSVKRRMRRMR